MMETMLSQARIELSLRRARESPERRREKKVTYRNHTGNNTRNATVYPGHPEESRSRQNNRLHLQTPAGQLQNNNNNNHHDLMSGYFDVHRSSVGTSNLSPIVHQNFPDDGSWFSPSPTYTLASNFPSSPQTVAGNDGHSPRSEVLQMSDQGQTWTAATPTTGPGPSEMGDMSFSDMQLGSSLGSFNSMVFSSARGSATSSLSENWNFPILDSTIDSSMATSQLRDLTLPNEFYQTGPIFDVSGSFNPVSPLYSPDIPFGGTSWYGQVYPTGELQPYGTNSIPQVDIQSPHTLTNESLMPNDPWDSQNGQVSNHQRNANAGNVAFEMPPGDPYNIHIARQDYLDTGQMNNFLLRPQQPDSPTDGSDSDGYHLMSYPSSSYESPQGSPEAGVSPPAHPPSPLPTKAIVSSPIIRKLKIEPLSPRHDGDPHPHLFSNVSGISKQKGPRGRQRGLTAQEKKEARDVREAKACWACHISKTKCSPCSPGKPCEQCARLAGKRRFCLFSCFNDPLESLSRFLVPDYLMGHFTKANVEQFVAKNATSWGTQYFFIQMDWGYRRYLTAEVVALALRSNSEMGFHHQTLRLEGGQRPALVRKQSPPLGIPLAAMDDMQNTYSRYIQDIVQSDFEEYVPIAYPEEEAEFAEKLLGVIGKYYNAGNARDNESDLLRRALEMHVTAVILERSLVLDPVSLHQVENHLHRQYPERSAPRCAQRQIKLAFFLLQSRRIERVLKDWGSMMWATNPSKSKDKEWALAFSVFVTLILVMDKTLGAAYYFCEGRIQNHGCAAERERAEFEGLVRLTQRELFERCKEIFHWKFKTRKGGKEACNPVRDGTDAFQGKSKSVDPDVVMFVRDLQNVVGEFEQDIRSPPSDTVTEYTDTGRLACIFLNDFLGK